MGSLSKGFSLLIVVILAISSIMRVESAFAQSIPQPSVPKFTLEYTDGSYDVPTTQTTDPYTGQIITHQGYHVNLTVFEMIIQNQLNPINDLYYNIQVKGHYTNEWIMFFDFSEGLPLQDSSSQQTIIKMGTLDQDGLTLQGAHKTIPIPTGGKEDIQVQALIGNIGRNASAPLAPWTFYGTESDWSSTQTITVPSVSNSTSLNPTQTPIETANPTDNNAAGNGITLSITTIVLIIVITGLATSIASIFIYRRYQKSSNSSISKSL